MSILKYIKDCFFNKKDAKEIKKPYDYMIEFSHKFISGWVICDFGCFYGSTEEEAIENWRKEYPTDNFDGIQKIKK